LLKTFSCFRLKLFLLCPHDKYTPTPSLCIVLFYTPLHTYLCVFIVLRSATKQVSLEYIIKKKHRTKKRNTNYQKVPAIVI
jgi:hypothetical protein